MSTSGSPRKHPPASPSRGHKPKDSHSANAAGPSRIKSTSPFQPDYASSSTTSSPGKRASISSSSRRNSRQTRTFQIADLDEDQDAPYDEELDADGEDDEEYLDQDADGEDEAVIDLTDTVEDQVEQASSRASSSKTPARQTVRPKRSNAPNVSYYAVPPLPSFSDDEQDEDETPSIRRRARKSNLPPTSDIELDIEDDNQDNPPPVPSKSSKSTRTGTPLASKHPSGKVPRRTSDLDSGESKLRTSAKPEDPELSEEAKQQAKAEREAEDLRSRWTEEYFEIVEQLPLEVHRTFALMRELEGQMQARVGAMVQNMTTYRDARLEMHKLIDTPSGTSNGSNTQGNHDRRRSSSGGSEDEAENLLGGSQDGPVNGQQQQSQDDDIEMLSVDSNDADNILDKDARRQLLRSISLAANESVKAAEEKMGLAATAYNWIDRHIRRLDADISKLESSILLGLRTGTEESRGAREALGLPVDDGAENETAQGHGEDGQSAATEGVSAEAESAALTKAAGAANRAPATGEAPTGGRRSARTTPKMGGQAQLAASPKRSERARTRSRSLSASAAPTAAGALTTTTTRKASSPAPTGTRTTRKRKPKPLSPQKGGRRSIVTSTPTLISPTTQTPRTGATTVGPDVSEMPFDPTEPTYCYCDQISFDEMVACDNDDCPYEWFHYACVGLSGQPKNEWYCRFCAPPGWKGEGMGVPANAKHKPVGFKKGIGIKP